MAILSPGFITNPTPQPNALFDLASIDKAVLGRQNSLLAQETTRSNLADADTERVSRLSQWMLTESGGDPTKMASLYSQAVPEEQRQGRLMNAPAVFPGEATIRRLASAGISSEKQGEIASNRQGWSQLFNNGTGSTPSTPGATTPADGTPPDYSVPRGTRNNNPLNLSFANQPGATLEKHPDPRFAKFGTPEEGVSAAVNQLKLYQSRGNSTLRGMISTWAPPSENDTEAYIKMVSQATGLDPDKPVNLDDPAVASKLVQAMARHETGRPPDPTIADRGVSAPVAPRGVAARTGGVDVAGPGAPPPSEPLVASGGLLAGLQSDQIAALKALQAANRPFSEGVALLQRFKAQNAAAAQHADTTARLARAEERAGVPSGYRRDPNNPDGLTYVVGGPADPKVIAQTGRDSIPSGYMRTPDGGLTYVVGGPADPKVIAAAANARGEGGRVLPSVERNLLVTHGGRLSELERLHGGFQNDYGGFKLGALGDLQNAIARNTPGESPRADWWQSYQRLKNSVRQELFGASLTLPEKAEFEKADVNPGMSAEAIRTNIDRQSKILRQALERRARSLVLEKHNQRAIEEASGLTLNMDEPADRKEPAASAPASRPPLSSFKR